MNGNKWISFSNAIDQGEGKPFIDSFLLEGHDVNAFKRDGRTVLSYACELGNLGIVKYLVEIGADNTIKNSDGSIPLHIAAKYGHEDIVELFYNLGVYVDSCDNNNFTPLHYAAESGRNQVAQFLLKNNADLNVITSFGDTPLLLAANQNHIVVVEFLVISGADVECCNTEKWTMLHYASRNGWLEIVQSLVNKKCDLNVNAISGITPLMISAKHNHRDVVEFLISSGADKECCDKGENTVLHFASRNGCLEIVQLLVNEQCNINVTIEFLINSGADVNCCNQHKMAVLHDVSFRGWLEVVQSLVDKKCDLNVTDGDTPLLLAASEGHRDVVEFLIISGADVECCDTEKWTVLHYASRNGWLEIVQSLANKKCDLNVKTIIGTTPLMIATMYNQRDVVEFLMNFGVDIDECSDVNKCTALHYASNEGWLEIVQSLVNKNCDLNVKASEGDTPLLIAASECYRDIVEFLISSGADVECSGADEYTVLHYACVYGWLEIVQSLVNKNCDLNGKTSEGDTPLLIAASECYRNIVEFLISSGADVECSGADEYTLFHYACVYGWLEIVQSHVNKKCDLNVKTSEGCTPLLLAAAHCHRNVVELLLKSGADVEYCDKFNWSMLHYASLWGWLEVLKTIITAETDLNAMTSTGLTALSLACHGEGIDATKHLLKAGADWNDNVNCIINNSLLRDHILKDTEVCTQAILNNFNYKDLPSFYKLPGCVERLPPIEKLKLSIGQNVEHKIETRVNWEIQTKGYCNLREVCPMVLQMLSVTALIDYYKLK